MTRRYSNFALADLPCQMLKGCADCRLHTRSALFSHLIFDKVLRVINATQASAPFAKPMTLVHINCFVALILCESLLLLGHELFLDDLLVTLHLLLGRGIEAAR